MVLFTFQSFPIYKQHYTWSHMKSNRPNLVPLGRELDITRFQGDEHSIKWQQESVSFSISRQLV